MNKPSGAAACGNAVTSGRPKRASKRYGEKTISAFAKTVDADGLTPESALILARELLESRQQPVIKRATPNWPKVNGHFVY